MALFAWVAMALSPLFPASETLTQPPLNSVNGANYTIRTSSVVNMVGSPDRPNDIYRIDVTGTTTVTGSTMSWNGWEMVVDSTVGNSLGATPQLGTQEFVIGNTYPVNLPLSVNYSNTFYVRSNCPFVFAVPNDAGDIWSLNITWTATRYADPSAPVAKPLYFSTRRTNPITPQLIGTDPNGDAIILYEVGTVSGGTVTPATSANGLVTITPNADTSLVLFSYRVKDATGLYSLQYAQVQVACVDTQTELIRSNGALRARGIGSNGAQVDPEDRSNPDAGTSTDPIIYATGDLVMTEDDLDQGNPGWGHRRTYSLRGSSGMAPHGLGWIPEERPFLCQVDTSLIVTLSGQSSIAFQPSGPNWASVRPYPGSLVAVGQDYVFSDAYGDRIVFNGFSAALPDLQRGQFKSFYRPSGDRFRAVYNAAGQLTTVVRQVDSSTSEEVGYTYLADNSAMLVTVQRRMVGTGGNTIVRTAEYGYYTGAAGEYGEAGNLKSVKVHGGDISGPLIREFYYRYHRTATAPGALGALRCAVGPRNCALMRSAGLDPWAVSDATLAGYADKSFEYTNLRVTKQILRTPDVDGAGTFTYGYADSAFANGFNTWKRCTTETYPDSSVLLVYSNYAGLPLLKVWKPTAGGAPLRLEGWTYDAAGRESWHIQPNAFVASGGVWYNEAKPDLLDIASGDSPYLNNASGRIDVRTYYGPSPVPAATPTVPGGVEGYLQYLQIKQGELGTATNTALREYLSHTN
jgi:hypothetical protein